MTIATIVDSPLSPTTFISARQRTALATIAALIGLILALQSYYILPYQVGTILARVADLEKDRRVDRDLIVTLQAQLIATQNEIIHLRTEMANWRSDRRGQP